MGCPSALRDTRRETKTGADGANPRWRPIYGLAGAASIASLLLAMRTPVWFSIHV